MTQYNFGFVCETEYEENQMTFLMHYCIFDSSTIGILIQLGTVSVSVIRDSMLAMRVATMHQDKAGSYWDS